MHKKFFRVIILSSLFASPFACTTPVANTAATSPYAYCEKAGTIDTPEASLQTPQNTDEIIQAMKRGKVLDASAQFKEPGACRWRCMDKAVYACCTGANLPCDAKADLNRTPSQGMNEYCAQNPNATFIPAYATGHATVYTWKCTGKTAAVDKQVLKTDARGYQVDFWHRVTAE